MWDKKKTASSGSGHTHLNKAVLDKFGESSGAPTYGGVTLLPDIHTHPNKEALDKYDGHLHTNLSALSKYGEDNGLPTFNGSVIGGGTGGTGHTHTNLNTLNKLSESGGSLTYNGIKIGGGVEGTGVILPNGLSAFYRDSVNLVDYSKAAVGFSMNPTTGVISANSASSVTDFLPVIAGRTYTTSADFMAWAWYDANKVHIGGHYGTDGLNSIKSGPGAGMQNDAPPNAAFLRVTGANTKFTNKFMVFQGTYRDAPQDFVPYHRYSPDSTITIDKIEGKFVGKKMIVFGDSISMDGDGSSSLKRGDRWTGAFERELGFKITNYAIGGSRITPEADGTDAFKSVYNVLHDGTTPIDYTAEYAVIFGGTNDHSKNMLLGTIADTTSATFYGALQLCVKKLLTMKVDMKLFLMTPIQKFMGHTTTDLGEGWFWNDANGNGDTLADFAQAIRDIGEKWSIPVIDLHKKARINEMTYALYLSSDKLHPSKEGQRVMADAMKSEIF